MLNRLLTAFAGVALVGLAVASEPVEMYEMPIFLGQADAEVRTESIRLLNHTTHTQRAVVTVDGLTQYPATVPPLKEASVTIFRTSNNYLGDRIELSAQPADGNGDRTSYFVQDTMVPAAANTKYLVISANAMPPSFLSSLPSAPGKAFGNPSIYRCLSKGAPSRPSAYGPFDAVLVSPDAFDGLDGRAITAIKGYVLLGGHLIFPSGIDDKRWDDLNVGQNRNVHLGLGTVTVLHVDLNAVSSHTQAAFQDAVRNVLSNDIPLSLDASSPAAIAPSPTVGADAASQVREDPFAIKLPPFFQVLGLLLLYFVAVVPLNFFVLNRLRRPEMTWITAPAFAAIFAAVLFRGAGALYGAKASTATRGVLYVQEGLPEGLFVGDSDLYVPHAGTIDLGLHNVDELSLGSRSNVVNMSGLPVNSLSAVSVGRPVAGSVDTGTVTVPKYEAKNLEFGTVSFLQRVPAENWFRFERQKAHDGFVPIRVTNMSPYTVRSARLIVGSLQGPLQDLRPGSSMTMETVAAPVLKAINQPVTLQMLAGLQGRILLTGQMEGLPVGCQVGRLVASHSNLALAAFARPDLKANTNEHS